MFTILPDFRAKLLLKLPVLTTAVLLIGLLPLGLAGATSSTVLINAVYYDAYLTGEPDEAFQLINVSADLIDLTNWTVTDNEATITLSGTLVSGQTVWIAREADDFKLEFGFRPDYEYQSDTDPTVPIPKWHKNWFLPPRGCGSGRGVPAGKFLRGGSRREHRLFWRPRCRRPERPRP